MITSSTHKLEALHNTILINVPLHFDHDELAKDRLFYLLSLFPPS